MCYNQASPRATPNTGSSIEGPHGQVNKKDVALITETTDNFPRINSIAACCLLLEDGGGGRPRKVCDC